jgi:hypothetical protein
LLVLAEWQLSADTVEEVGFEEAARARACGGGHAVERSAGSGRCDRRRHPNEHRHLAEVLGGRSEVELVSGTAWTANRSRSSFTMRLRWANNISTFLRSRLEVT